MTVGVPYVQDDGTIKTWRPLKDDESMLEPTRRGTLNKIWICI